MAIQSNWRRKMAAVGWQGPFSLSLSLVTGLVLSLEATLTGPGLASPFTMTVLLSGLSLYFGICMGRRGWQRRTADPLTGLADREAVHAAIEGHAGGALMLCELTGAGSIAATHGLKAEEKLIAEAAARLVALLPEQAMAARAGRASFLVFLPGTTDPLVVAGLARAINSSFATGIELNGLRVNAPNHSGIALAPRDAKGVDGLVACAELALAAAREQDMSGYGFFDPQAAAATLRRRQVQRAVAAAHASGAFRLVYQPIHHMRSGELSGFEALMRLDDPELGPISPAEFIPATEQAGLIAEVGGWALEEACRTASLWAPHLVVTVNLSPAQFLSGSIVQTIRQVLERHGLPAYRLEVEITEGTLIEDSELVLSQVRTLREMGVGVALDDFGTGYSSLGYLWKFPFSKLKIDRSFTAAIEQSPPARGILRSIVKLGHGLGMAVTAEGIESQRQLGLLRDLGCDLAQGYLLGRPAPPEELAAIIMRNLSQQIAQKARGPMPAPAVHTG